MQPTPPKNSGLMWIETIGGGERHGVVCLSTHVMGVQTHFSKKGTRPCYEDESRCEGGHDPDTLRWKGYIHAYHQTEKRQVIVQLTVRAARMLLEKFGPAEDLRGYELVLTRTQADNGRVSCMVKEYTRIESERLAAERVDFWPSIFKLWKMKPMRIAPLTRDILTVQDLPPEEEFAAVG